jgi:hypothetical protein
LACFAGYPANNADIAVKFGAAGIFSLYIFLLPRKPDLPITYSVILRREAAIQGMVICLPQIS